MGRTKIASARQRLLDAADRLFYSEGFRAVGIDRIIAESGVAKMTLYSHFRSKDDLILAVLRHREEQFLAWFASPGFRGCAFINASVELADAGHPGSVFTRQHKERFHAFLAKLIEESLGESAARLSPAVALLIEGAIVTAVIRGSSDPAEVAREAAKRLVSRPKRG